MHPHLFVTPEDFLNMHYSYVLKKFVKIGDRLYQRVLFAIVHQLGKNTIR